MARRSGVVAELHERKDAVVDALLLVTGAVTPTSLAVRPQDCPHPLSTLDLLGDAARAEKLNDGPTRGTCEKHPSRPVLPP
jgi:hypothetical protein